MTKPSREDVLMVAGEPVGWKELSNHHNGAWFFAYTKNKNSKQIALYTETQLLAMYAAGAEAMRERVAEWHKDEGWLLDEDDVPDAIRALPITPTNTEGEQG